MYKFIVTFLCFTVIYSLGFSQKFFDHPNWDYYWDMKAHEQGQIHFTYGYGKPRLDKSLFKYHKDEINFKVRGLGPFFFRTEYGIKRNLSVALSGGYIQYTSDWDRLKLDTPSLRYMLFQYGTKAHDIWANLRFNYHYFVDKDWDIYIGGGVGYNIFIHKDFTKYTPEDTIFNAQFKHPYPMTFEMTAGVRYFFMTRTAIYVEMGYNKSFIQGGFVFKFRHRKRQ